MLLAGLEVEDFGQALVKFLGKVAAVRARDNKATRSSALLGAVTSSCWFEGAHRVKVGNGPLHGGSERTSLEDPLGC